MTLTRTELIERLKQLAESEPPKNLAYGTACYSPCTDYLYVGIACPDCQQNESITLFSSDFDKKTSEKNLGTQFYEQFSQIPDLEGTWGIGGLRFGTEDSHQCNIQELRTKLEEFFRARIKQDPGYFDSLLGTKKLSILKNYEGSFAKVQEQGLDVKLIIPEHCPRCGFELQEKEFFLEIKYQDQTESTQIKLENAFDLELMALFLQGNDRFDGCDGEHSLKDEVARLRKLFGAKE